MSQNPTSTDLFSQIESLQDEVLTELDALNLRIESALAQHGMPAGDETQGGSAG